MSTSFINNSGFRKQHHPFAIIYWFLSLSSFHCRISQSAFRVKNEENAKNCARYKATFDVFLLLRHFREYCFSEENFLSLQTIGEKNSFDLLFIIYERLTREKLKFFFRIVINVLVRTIASTKFFGSQRRVGLFVC